VKQRLPLFLSLFRRGNADEAMSHESFVSSGADKMARFLAVNAVMFVLFWLAGAGIWYWGVWVVGMATWLSLVTRIRNIAEHACTSTGEDPFSHARTTLAGPIERLLIAPYWVNYHAEHHLFMYLPCYRPPKAHRLLAEKGRIELMVARPGYLEVMRLATSRQIYASCTETSGRTRSAPRKPAAEPSKIPATATNDASESVESPVRPCPTEQP
jgi:fatty acid desaturase